MLEGLVAWILNNYLGKYVQLNTDQLSVALLSGKVELENLPLKEDALRHLGLPVVIKSGFIGKVNLQVPVGQIRSAPWVIAIEQLYLVASPISIDEWDHESEELARHESKLDALDALEAKWRLDKDVQDANSAYYASSYSSWFSYGAGLVSEIIENLQLRIQDVHIRYEDSTSIPDQTIAFGVTLQSLVAQSCDSNWLPGFIHTSKSEESFKLLDIQKFAMYWSTVDEEDCLSTLSPAGLAEAFNSNKMKKNIGQFIIPSVSAHAHLKRHRSTQPLRSTTPRIVCDLSMEEVPITLSDRQYNQIVGCLHGLENLHRLRKYRQFKPLLPVKSDARAWWLYAISCFYPGKQPAICKPRPTWEVSLKKAKQNVCYVKICKKLLITPTITLGIEEKKAKDEIEWTREYEELVLLREVAMKSVKLPSSNSSNKISTGQSMLVNWFPNWMGWYSSSTSSVEVNDTPSSETSQLEGEILQVLADSAEYNTIFKRDFVFGQFNFCLKFGTVSLCAVDEATNVSVPMLELEYKNLSLSILSKPRSNSHSVEISLGAVYLRDKITPNSMFPILVGPPGLDRTSHPWNRVSSPRVSVTSMNRCEMGDIGENLFYFAYEKKPPNSGCDYRLSVKSKCLDVVYQPNVLKWLTEFICLPHKRDITQSQIEAMKNRTKKELIKNWEHILEGRMVTRTSWDLDLDITAPQIIFVEQFTDQNSAMAVIDFGKFQLKNNIGNVENEKGETSRKESEDLEMFLTPCSTPPVSEESDLGTAKGGEQDFPINESNIHDKLYDCYSLELTDMQILLGKAKDNWRYALSRGFSNLHLLDRFSISLQLERRVVYTSDPHFPSLTVNANLPKLFVHINENKISTARNLFHLITVTGLPSPLKATPIIPEDEVDAGQEDESVGLNSNCELSQLIIMQFTVDQMSLEIQSRGRSITELQVAGVRVAVTKCATELSVALTVHSLLLVDALQTFGADFELLVASHKHVGMDSVSGSMLDSEPTSPTSPASPDPGTSRSGATSPLALSQALNTLATVSPLESMRRESVVDSEALISVEVVLKSGVEPVQIANIQFNNLDIIANQETIVELIGFIRRVFPKSHKPEPSKLFSKASVIPQESTESQLEEPSRTDIGSTEITFDFHRLNVLLLRGVIKNGNLHGKKICTATMSKAKIKATVGSKIEMGGSLGGLQVLDLTPEGQMHQRIVSVGYDPLIETTHTLCLITSSVTDEETAFRFNIVRDLKKTSNEKDTAVIVIRMASLWYTHSPYFIAEIRSCANEFKQYLSNLARSIKSAATDMALGLVHARAEALAETLNMSKKLPNSIYSSALSFTESTSPNKKRRRRYSSNELSGYSSAKDTFPQTPYSPADMDDLILNLNLDIEFASPVIVLPRSNSSSEVFVGHLGKINISNTYSDDMNTNIHNGEYSEHRSENYIIEIRDMNIYSVDTSSRRILSGNGIPRAETLYNCTFGATPILHDTKLKLNVQREINRLLSTRRNSDANLLLEDTDFDTNDYNYGKSIQVTGSIVTALKLSLTRLQYEQIIDTLQWITSTPQLIDLQDISRAHLKLANGLADINEDDTGVTTLNMDPHVRAKLFPTINSHLKNQQSNSSYDIRVIFDIPVFSIELRGHNSASAGGLVDLSFRDFAFNYDKSHNYETSIQISLRSILMEDLLQPVGSKQRAMVISSTDVNGLPSSTGVSRSCPDVTYTHYLKDSAHGSLPDHLEAAEIFGMEAMSNSTYSPTHKNDDYPCTPPPSPLRRKNISEKNLVLISILLADRNAPNFEEYYGGCHKSTSIDFNCLDLVISVKSWVVVLDFFNISSKSDYPATKDVGASSEAVVLSSKEKEVTNITVKSLTVVLIEPNRDIAKANISNVEVEVKCTGVLKEVDGKLGSMSLQDLTLDGQLYKERFMTSGRKVLQFKYVRHPPDINKNYDAQLTLDMASVIYVHTKRFIAEILAFFNKFTERQQMVVKGIQAATSGQQMRHEPLRLSLILKAHSPMILLPVSSSSPDLLVVDLGQLLVTNTFKFSGDEGTISIPSNDSTRKCLLDVMKIQLENMDLYAGIKETRPRSTKLPTFSPERLKLGSIVIVKDGPSLLTKKFRLSIQAEQNLHKKECHAVPDLSIYGNLSTIDGALDLKQYKLIRGLLAFNLGEDTENIHPSVSMRSTSAQTELHEDWKLSSIRLDMQNVTLSLVKSHVENSPLARINFIKSHLTVENYSNFCQDIDLVSREILIADSRFNGMDPAYCKNVFTNILQPMKLAADKDLVQAEVHSRKRQDHHKVTVLLNDIRLMAIFDWWESMRDYIFQNIDNKPENKISPATENVEENIQFDLKLNITDSEIVVVQDSSQWHTNTVILKSTTVLKYRPYNTEKPLSCSLNNCEMFSCMLGMEDETALSIIDPVTLTLEINRNNILEIQFLLLFVRLSYHDVCMFTQILNSLPKQLFSRNENDNTSHIKEHIAALTVLGFHTEDCLKALKKCGNRIDDAAIWLTMNAKPSDTTVANSKKAPSIEAVEVKGNRIAVCVIDDCGDSDVPLLELSLTKFNFKQLISKLNSVDYVPPQGYINGYLASDYYNRVLSGWEPILEPWKCKISWEKNISQVLWKNKLTVKVESDDTLDINVTSTVIDLYKQVKDNWTKDYYNVRPNEVDGNSAISNLDNFRRRSPFVPYALKNDTGSPLRFATMVTDMDTSNSTMVSESCENWVFVSPGETVPFSFTSRDKIRHQDSHKTRMHQLGVKVEGWQCLQPVAVDRVGVFFRDAPSERQSRSVDSPPARIVFDITLEGSARKLVTIRSALLILNHLPQSVEIKLESRLPHDSFNLWTPSRSFVVGMKETLAVPLVHTHSQINVRPTGSPHQYTFGMPSINWTQMPSEANRMYQLATSHTHKGHNYRFCAEIIKENSIISSIFVQPAHRIHLLPTVKLENLLPVDISYMISGEKGSIKAGSIASITTVDPNKMVELHFGLENFRTCNSVIVPECCSSEFTCRIKLEDNRQRKLYLLGCVYLNRGAKLRITISAYYWILNRTGLPLVFRQSGTSVESAGQFDEHEQARMVTPLLFSFSDQDGSPTINARVGKRVVWDGTPQWCANFHVQKGTQYRKLHVTMRDGKPDTVFIVGLEVRPGRGKYRSTTIVTISPRYQLYNRSCYKLLFAQAGVVKTSEPGVAPPCLKAVPDSHLPFHWPNLQKEQLLCVSIEDVPGCCWSGGLKIDSNDSMHVNIRDSNGRVFFLRLEVLLQGATYFVVFTDADKMPPPIRVDNFSEVSIKFGQACYIDFMHSTARAHSSVPYAWDEPTKTHSIRLVAPGGVSNNYSMGSLGSAPGLTYENFIYIAFAGTFKNPRGIRDPNDVDSQELVLDVVKHTKIILAHKIPSERSQLWRMTSEGYLQHEGSNPPLPPGHPQSRESILVLDIEGTAPQPNAYSKLMLRRIDPRRKSTQKWRFTEDGRLCCDHFNMCVQASDGFYGLRPGNAAVLGLPQPVCYNFTDKGIPIEHAIERQRLRPGSGFLSVNIHMDGPTQVISIKDMKKKKMYAAPDEREWGAISKDQRPNLTKEEAEDNGDTGMEMQFRVHLRGLGVSLVCRKTPEELLYSHFSTIVAEASISSASNQFCISIKDIQIDNQIMDTTVPVIMYITPANSKTNLEGNDHLPALDFNAEMQKKRNENAVIFKHVMLRLKKITTVIEERLLLKLCDFIGIHSQGEELINKDENDYETQKLLSEVSAVHAKRYYFGIIKLTPDQIKLSVTTASKLPDHLQRIKRKLGLTLIKFEDAAIDLEAFERRHPFETSQFLFKSIVKHFKDELKWQAGIILGSVDFIGNPIGLMNDVSEGLSGFIYEGNVGALVKNVTHGMSNSAAKITESLSDGLGRVTMDENHEEIRQKIRQVQTGRSSDHIMAGFKGLGFGILGGATGIFKQVYEGASNEGLQGVFSGLGKGLVGAVTKPVVGMLDFASETARAVRDSSKSKLTPSRIRYPRCVNGPGGLLPKYDARQSQGQQYLYTVNEKNYDEQLVSFQVLGSASEDLLCIVSDKMIRIVTSTRLPDLTTIIECDLSNLETCNVIAEKEQTEYRFYIEIVMHYAGVSAALVNPDPIKKPRVRCRTVDLANSVARQMNYAKRMYIERLYTLTNDHLLVLED